MCLDDVCLMLDDEREDGRRNSVTLFRIPGDSDNSIVNGNLKVAKNFIIIFNKMAVLFGGLMHRCSPGGSEEPPSWKKSTILTKRSTILVYKSKFSVAKSPLAMVY